MVTLMAYVAKFLNARDVSADYASQIRKRCRSFVRFCRRSVKVSEIDAAMVNAWLKDLQDRRLSPVTVDGYRRNLLVVWRAAVEDGLTDTLPVRVRKIKIPRRMIEAYTMTELRALLTAAGKLKGCHSNGNRRADFWQAFIHAGYSTALRRSDLLLVFRCQIDPGGMAAVVQHKTGEAVRVRFSQQALQFAHRLCDRSGLLLPWPYRKDALAPRFRAIRKAAGINRGSFKWIRRSAASYAERLQCGAGTKILGHRGAGVFRSHYEDWNITQDAPVSPPALF